MTTAHKKVPPGKKVPPAKKVLPSSKGTGSTKKAPVPRKRVPSSGPGSSAPRPSTGDGRATTKKTTGSRANGSHAAETGPPAPPPPPPPSFHLPPGINLSKLAVALEASLLTESLYEFAKACWHIVEPGVKFQDNWHLKVICNHLEAVSDGRIKNLIINIPPRSMKSLLVSVIWPAWDWTRKPSRKWLFSSYGQKLALRDAVKMRRLVQSPWYQSRFGKGSFHAANPTGPGGVCLTGDQNEKTRYENDQLGYRISTSVGGLGTGEGGDIIVCDDPHNVLEAESETVRETTLTWWNETMSTRGNDPVTVARVIVMQRVHENDLTADQLLKGGWELLCLPMEFEREHPTPSKTSLKFVDPRKFDGELLWPGRFTMAALYKLKRLLGKYGIAGQLQQRPTPRGGGLFEEQYTKLWPADKMLPDFFYVIKSYDTAYTDKTQNDPTAANVFGLFHIQRPKGGMEVGVMLLHSWGDFMTYPKLKKRVIKEWKDKYGVEKGTYAHLRPGRRGDIALIEHKGSGISLVQDLRMSRIPVYEYNPGHADKTSRGHQILPWYEMGNFYVMESVNDPGDYVAWARPFTSQLHRFGPGVSGHDDHVDTFTQAIIFGRDRGLIPIEAVEDDDDEVVVRYDKVKRTGTYG